MIVIVAGGRDHDPDLRGYDWLDKFHVKYRITELHHGDCPSLFRAGEFIRSTDRFAAAWGTFMATPKVTVVAHPVPAWAWRMVGRGAGPLRNGYMVRHVGAQGLIAFRGGKGTEGIVKMAKDEGLRVWRPDEGEEP